MKERQSARSGKECVAYGERLRDRTESKGAPYSEFENKIKERLKEDERRTEGKTQLLGGRGHSRLA